MKYFSKDLIDFASKDYLGFSKNKVIFEETQRHWVAMNSNPNGTTDSRLAVENYIATFHQTESALIFDSGHDAYHSFFNSIPQKGDLILYDELCHRTIRDAIQLATAKSHTFQHNDFEDLEKQIERVIPSAVERQHPTPIYIITESVFALDGDMPNLEELVALSRKYNCHLVLDESHSLGVFGDKGQGLVQMLQLQNKVFARIISFGNALGSEGAAIIGSNELKEYFFNFDSSFMNQIGLSPNAVAQILVDYQNLESDKKTIERLRENRIHFNQEISLLGLKPMFVQSKSAIHSAIIPRNQNAKTIVSQFQEKGFAVKVILSPEVPEGQERLRFCLHSFNTKEEISELLGCWSTFIFR